MEVSITVSTDTATSTYPSKGSGELTQVTTASRAVGVALQPVHNVFQVSAMAAALTPHKHSLHYMVAHCAYAGTLVTPRGEEQRAGQTSLHQIKTKTQTGSKHT